LRSTSSAKGARSRTTSGNRSLSSRDVAILEHVATYRLSIRPIIQARFFNGADPDNVLNALVKDGRLQTSARGLAGGYSWYQLTRREAKARGRSEHLGRFLRDNALHEALAVLWFCRGPESNRHLLEAGDFLKPGVEDTDQLLGGFVPPAREVYCIDETSGTVLRVFVPGSTAGDDQILKIAREESETAFSDPRLFPLLKRGDLVFAILVEDEGKRARVEASINDSDRLVDAAQFQVFRAPGPTTLKEFLP
jgi:hypothetical protein